MGGRTAAEMVLGQAGDERILRAAVLAGVRWICAPPDQRLPTLKGVRIVTKLALREAADHQQIVDEVRAACLRIGADRLDVLLANPRAPMWSAVKRLRDEGLIYDLGAEAHTPDEALAALADRDVNHLEVAFDPLDASWRAVGEAAAHRPNVTIHARAAVPHDAQSLMPLVRELDRDSPADLSLACLRAQSWIHGVIVDVRSLGELALHLALFKRPPLNLEELAAIGNVQSAAIAA